MFEKSPTYVSEFCDFSEETWTPASTLTHFKWHMTRFTGCWYNLQNLKNVKNTHRRVILSVKLCLYDLLIF